MEIDKKLFFISGFLTIILFISIYSLNFLIGEQREEKVNEDMDNILREYEEIQAIMLMSNIFGKESSCTAMEQMMLEMDENLWDLGIKIEKYRKLTEEYMKDSFYITQKETFNRKQIIYYSLLKEVEEWCGQDRTTILYFYKKKEECEDCDAMSFVLTNIKKDVENELAIFSFDANLELNSLNVLIDHYNVSSYPCIVIEDKTYCGFKDRSETIKNICNENENFSLCQTE